MVSLPFLPLMRILYGRETGQKYTSFLFQFQLVVVEEVETAILPEMCFSKTKHGG